MTVHPPINDAEFEQVKAQRNEAVGRAEVAERELAAANAEVKTLRKKLSGVACAHVFTTEEGKRFVFVEDLLAALDAES